MRVLETVTYPGRVEGGDIGARQELYRPQRPAARLGVTAFRFPAWTESLWVRL